MPDRHHLGRHLAILAWVVATAFVLVSTLGYEPADWPASNRVTIGHSHPTPVNPCGPLGALVAHLLIAGLGAGAVWVDWAIAAGGWRWLIRRRPLPEVPTRLLGLALLAVVTSAAIAGMDVPPGSAWLPRAPISGSGGFLGGLGSLGLERVLGPVGRGLVLFALGSTGLALAADLVVPAPLRLACRKVFRLLQPVPPAPRTAANLPAVLGNSTAMPQPSWRPLPSIADFQSAAREAVRPASSVPATLRGAFDPRPNLPAGDYELPPLEILEPPPPGVTQGEHEAKLQERALLLEKTLLEHGCVVRVVRIDTGPVITQFEIELEAGLRLSKVTGLANDLAIALAVQSVRIVAPLPGKNTVGIEVPNDRRSFVRLIEVIEGTAPQLAQTRIPIYLGKDVKGTPILQDLADMPHLLIAGRTGTGKSVCLNAIILSILMTRRPDEVKLILFDPKMVELSQFKRIPHLMHPPVTDMKKAESILSWACDKMDERYAFLARAQVRNIAAYNALGPEELASRLRLEEDEDLTKIPTHMPYIVIIADELADLMMTAAKEVEQHIIRLAQKARAAGIHLILATQRPTVDVITGLIKANMPARIGFQVTSRNDSRVVLDEMGAEKLLGNGDLLLMPPNTSHMLRAQGTFISDMEVNRICQFMERYPVEFSKELTQLQVGGGLAGKDRATALRERDELYEAAIEIVIREQRGSCSLLQRALGIGYGRAARLIDFMAEDGVVGEFKSGSAREVLYSWDDWQSMKEGGAEDAAA